MENDLPSLGPTKTQHYNDGIDPDRFSLTYHTIDDAIAIVHSLGPGSLMAKAELKSAFCLCPVHPLDWPLLAFRWKGAFYVDKCHPFGLRSAPFLFNQVADALQWILGTHFGTRNYFHYLDDFFFAGPPADPTCGKAQRICYFCADAWGSQWSQRRLSTPLRASHSSASSWIRCPGRRRSPLTRSQLSWIRWRPSSRSIQITLADLQTSTAIPNWQTLLCYKGHPSWKDLPTPAVGSGTLCGSLRHSHDPHSRGLPGYPLVSHVPSFVERHSSILRPNLVKGGWFAPVHGRFLRDWLWGILKRSLALSSQIPLHWMEGTVCDRDGLRGVGSPLDVQALAISLRQPSDSPDLPVWSLPQ